MLILNDMEPRGLGYIEIDHRAGGLAPAGLPKHFEADTYTCSHCQTVVILNPLRRRERYKCTSCSHHICDKCAANVVAGAACLTWNRFIEELATKG